MFELRLFGIFFIIVLAVLDPVWCWDGDELEVFDVVEEVNQNFYTLLDVPENADQGQIKKAFRRLSLILHPDKNDAPDAEIKFRQLVAVYDVLKDVNKRRCYDDVLVNGLPDWKQAVYYYRRVRKMGLTEMSIILFIIISIGQYLVGWAQYLEHKFNVDDYLNTKTKKLMKKQKKAGVKVDISAALPPEFDLEHYKPSIKNTLPFQVPRFIWFLLVGAPPLTYRFVRDYWDERRRLKLLETEEQEESEEEDTVAPVRGPRRRKVGFTVPELKEDISANKTTNNANKSKKKEAKSSVSSAPPPIIAGGLWTDDDLVELVKLVKKYPVGTTERWEKIGDVMRRPAGEVAHMAHKVKDNMVKQLNNRNPIADSSEDSEDDYDGGIPPSENQAYVIQDEPKKVKTRGGKLGLVGANDGPVVSNDNGSNWSQVQQKALESALAKYPKGGTTDRWEKIAKCVPGKTKEECMLRYKQLVELVKKKKDPVDETESHCTNNTTEIPDSDDVKKSMETNGITFREEITS